MQSSWNLKRAVLLSFIIHFATPIFASRCDSVAGWLEPQVVGKKPEREPMVFEFIEPTDGPIPEEVPETNLASTRKSLARSRGEEAVSENDLPVSSGQSPVKELKKPGSRADESEPSRPRPPDRELDRNEGKREAAQSPFSRSVMRREVSQSVEEQRFMNPRGRSTTLPGDLSFNTVDFEFAPYLLELKRRIEAHWWPPIASYGSGYKGASVIRFGVSQSGELDLLEVVTGADHESLDIAASNAVRYGAPFPPLPDDFPENRWVITCTFHYR